MSNKGVLLVNLGTPDSANPRDVKRYLIEFLTDPRVIDTSWLMRQILVRSVIVPNRYKQSAENYRRIWTPEGSPLMVYSQRMRDKLQSLLGSDFSVQLAMRYQNPSIESALNKLKHCSKLVIVPLFPQYASATTGSIHQKVMEIISRWNVIPELYFANSYPVQREMIEAFCERGREHSLGDYDHFLFSFHGLPERQVIKADMHAQCLKNNCCARLCHKNQFCYVGQCHATARAIAEGLSLKSQDITISFQSRLGKDPWIKPYTSEILKELLARGKKRILVFCPAFVCDCLETLDEIGNEYRHDFIQAGGEVLDLVAGLNDHPLWIAALRTCLKSLIG